MTRLSVIASSASVKRLTEELEYPYQAGRKAKMEGKPISDCPYSACDAMLFCAWRGGWADADYVDPILLEGEEILLGGDHAHSLRSCA